MSRLPGSGDATPRAGRCRGVSSPRLRQGNSAGPRYYPHGSPRFSSVVCSSCHAAGLSATGGGAACESPGAFSPAPRGGWTHAVLSTVPAGSRWRRVFAPDRQLAVLTTQQRQAFSLVEMAPPAPCRSRSARSLAVRRGVTRIQSPTLLLLSPPIPLATRSTHSLDYPLLVLSL